MAAKWEIDVRTKRCMNNGISVIIIVSGHLHVIKAIMYMIKKLIYIMMYYTMEE